MLAPGWYLGTRPFALTFEPPAARAPLRTRFGDALWRGLAEPPPPPPTAAAPHVAAAAAPAAPPARVAAAADAAAAPSAAAPPPSLEAASRACGTLNPLDRECTVRARAAR